jgi:hypothetical protein
MLMPPSGGLLSRPATTRGYYAAPITSKIRGALSRADG